MILVYSSANYSIVVTSTGTFRMNFIFYLGRTSGKWRGKGLCFVDDAILGSDPGEEDDPSESYHFKGKSSSIVPRRLVGYEWGLKPRFALWIYTAIVRPQLTYGFLVRCPKTTFSYIRRRTGNLTAAGMHAGCRII